MAYDKVVDSAQLEAAITATADAIRAKNGSTDLLEWTDEGFAEAVAGIQAGSGSEDLSWLISGQNVPTEYTNNEATYIKANCFSSHHNLKKVSFSKAVGVYAFAFQNCSQLEEVNFPILKSLQSSAFKSCTKLTEISLPELINVSGSEFDGCTALTSISFPKLTRISSSMFENCTSLTDLNIPLIEEVGSYAFTGCKALKKLDLILAQGKSIGYDTFKSSGLETLILRNTVRTNLSSTTSFVGTPIASGTGYIYVPAALIEEYKAATNWATYANQFRAIEDYPDICGGE